MIQEQIVLKHTYTVNSGSAAVVTFPLADICYIGGRAILQLAQLIMLLCKRMITNMAKIRCLQTCVHLNWITFPWRYPPPPFFFPSIGKYGSICTVSCDRTIWPCLNHWIPNQTQNNRCTSILESVIANIMNGYIYSMVH